MFRCRFAWQVQGIVHLVKSEQNVVVGGFAAFPKSMAVVGHLNRICKDAFSVVGAVQETSSSELLGGPGADFLRVVAFWSIGSSVLGKWFCVTGQVQHFVWHGITFSWQAQHFRQRPQNELVRGRQLCTQLFERCLAELFCFWRCQLRKLRKSGRIVSFLMLSSSKNEEVWKNWCIFDVAKVNTWGSLAE